MTYVFDNIRKVQDYAADNDVTVHVVCDNLQETHMLLCCINEVKFFMDKSQIVENVEDIYSFAIAPNRNITANEVKFTNVMHMLSVQDILNKNFMI